MLYLSSPKSKVFLIPNLKPLTLDLKASTLVLLSLVELLIRR